MHAELKGATGENLHDNYAACTIDEMKLCAGVHYWALGHIHTRQVISESEPAIVYPGSLQAVRINEEGPHGAALVEWSDIGEKPKITFLDIAETVISSINVDLSECKSLTDVHYCLRDALDKFTDNDFVKVTLTGRVPGPLKKEITTKLDISKVIDAISLDEESLIYEDRSELRIDLDSIEGESSIRGIYLEKARGFSHEKADEKFSKILPPEFKFLLEDKEFLRRVHDGAIEFGIAALSGEEKFK